MATTMGGKASVSASGSANVLPSPTARLEYGAFEDAVSHGGCGYGEAVHYGHAGAHECPQGAGEAGHGHPDEELAEDGRTHLGSVQAQAALGGLAVELEEEGHGGDDQGEYPPVVAEESGEGDDDLGW
jgi:hypothetical protein